MGLDFRGSSAHFGYAGFHFFRTKLAKVIGIDYDKMQGLRSDDDIGICWCTVKDPIKLFLTHSDCDGHLTAKQCLKIAPRLKELINLNLKDFSEYEIKQGLQLADDMQRLGEAGEKLIFC